MKLAFSIVVFALAGPLLAQEQSVSDQVLKVALTSLRYHPFVVSHDEDLSPARFVISDATIGGAEGSLREFLGRWHGQQIADEMLASYHINNATVQRMKIQDVAGIQVRSLDDFASSANAYSWPALRDKLPQVRSVVRVSRPAFDRLATYAVVRYERISEDGPVSASFFEFAKNRDGSWTQKHGEVGDLWQ